MRNKKVILLIVCLVTIGVILAMIFLVAPSVLKTRYKINHEQSILRYAKEYGLEPALVCAVIYTESSFNENAKSRVGATGLMQIMPATGMEIAAGIGREPYSEEMLNEPDLNIEFGCYYLSKMIDRFDGNVYAALAAYNAGPRKAKEWIDTYGLDDEGKIALIPYPETDKYVDRVIRARDVYFMLYGTEWEGQQ